MNDWLSLDKKNIWHPFTPLEGSSDSIFITSASGVYLHTNDGKQIIDAISSWWINLHGHSNPYIAQALATQATKLEHVMFAGFTHEPAITLSKNLLSILPKNQSKIFFSDNGSTAVEVALKLAIQFWYNQGSTKDKIIAIKGSYHGDTFGAMSVAERNIFTGPFTKYLFDTNFIDFPDHENSERVLHDFKSMVDQGNVAAFIFEPLVQGAAGMRIYQPEFLDQLLSYAKANDVVCIADEVFTGFGRTGKFFATDYLKNDPDIIAVSKGLTGGTLPMGITSCNQKIVNAFQNDQLDKTFFHGHSFTANPLACAVANASFDLLIKPECQDQIKMISDCNQNFMNKIHGHKKINDARVMGTILAIELKSEESTSYQNSLRKKIFPYFIDKGILLRPLGNVIYIVPPYVITQDQLTTIYNTIEEFLIHHGDKG
jgi:adenosylmethionine-8-amino-7-oxononanoate aminotransferase